MTTDKCILYDSSACKCQTDGYPDRGCPIYRYFESIYKQGKNNKAPIPYLMHKEMGIPISDCQKAYDVAIEYLRSQAKVKS